MAQSLDFSRRASSASMASRIKSPRLFARPITASMRSSTDGESRTVVSFTPSAGRPMRRVVSDSCKSDKPIAFMLTAETDSSYITTIGYGDKSMKMPNYWDREIEGFEREDFNDMEDVIIGWRDGLCPFGKLADDQDVPAKKVAVYAQSVADMLVPESRLISEKPKLLKVVDYASRLAAVETAKIAIRRAAKVAKESGFDVRDALELFSAEVRA